MTQQRVLLVFGTRPEAIKMAPILFACGRHPHALKPIVCSTGQHRELVTQVLDYFGIVPDYDLHIMTPAQSLAHLTAQCLEGIDGVLTRECPDCVLVQGDTTTALAGATAAFYRQIPVVHVEAGLRSGNLHAPWCEEWNRRTISMTAALHCAPTRRAEQALLKEGVARRTIHVTGNTVVDALLATLARERNRAGYWEDKYPMLGGHRMVLVTAHRRENIGPGLTQICHAVATLAARFPDCRFVFPVHPNPQVQTPVRRSLSGIGNVHLIEPVSYPEFVWLLDRSTLVLTDSGGIQEEAPTLSKPVVIMRDTTERLEGVELGTAILAGAHCDRIVDAAARLLTDQAVDTAGQPCVNPFGDGQAAERIVQLVLQQAWLE